MMKQNGEILSNEQLQDDYYHIIFYAPTIARDAQPGMFVHVQVPDLPDHILRRPFSIYDVEPENGTLHLVYKVVGEGTRALRRARPGTVCAILGPLGHGFSPPAPDARPVLIAGGFGAAAVFLQAKRASKRPVLLLGARTERDLILLDRFREVDAEIKIATNDGSCGVKGFVTELLTPYLTATDEKFTFHACGPNPMLKACGKLFLAHQRGDAELSLDEHMCCGVGACFACVVKLNADNPDHFRYARSCSEGPVFRADQIYFEEA